MNAYILGGGQSTRMGSNKALVEIDGTPMCMHIYNSLKEAGAESVFLITKTPILLPIPQIIELYEKNHPLYGVHIALEHTNEDFCLITPCDIPFVSVSSYRQLMEKKYPSFLCGHKTKQPLLGLFSQELRDLALHYAQEERSVMSFVDAFHTILVNDDELRNINTKQDIEDAYVHNRHHS